MYRMLLVFGLIFSLIVISVGNIGTGEGGSIDYGNISNVENGITEHDYEALNGILEENNYIPDMNGSDR